MTVPSIHGLANKSGEIVAFVVRATESAEAIRERVQHSEIQFVATDDTLPFTLTISEEHISVLQNEGGKGFVSRFQIVGQETQSRLVGR